MDKELLGSNKSFFVCSVCGYVQVSENDLPAAEVEHARYKQHHNSLTDTRYISYLEELNQVLLPFIEDKNIGLDFGCGPIRAMESLWGNRGKKVSSYDPFFHSDASLLKNGYEFVICSEVIEHFHRPVKEFSFIDDLLKVNGILAIRTEFFEASREFQRWHYQRDFTHVGFFSLEAFHWISRKFRWQPVLLRDPFAIFRKVD